MRVLHKQDACATKDIDFEIAEMLEKVGVDTVIELAQRNPENLYNSIVEFFKGVNWIRQIPPITRVKEWVITAKDLPRKIDY